MKYTHGGDRYAAQQVCPGELLDFSVNVNPLGTPPEVVQAVQQALIRLDQYPDPQCRALREAIACREGCPEEWVVCGNGGSELIHRLVRLLHPATALLTAPTFSEYEQALRGVDARCLYAPLDADHCFDVTEGLLSRIKPGVELVILCSPNNPTGRLIEEGLLQHILNRCASVGAMLLVDQSFMELSDVPVSGFRRMEQHRNLVLLRAFTKSYAIPALRLGYCISANRQLCQKMEALAPSWEVSLPAQLAGVACCQLPNWPERGRALIAQGRPMMEQALTELGAQVVPSHAGYLLFRLPGQTELKELLLRQGVLIRSCTDYRGLGADWYRVAVRLPQENQRLIEAIRSVLGGTAWQR